MTVPKMNPTFVRFGVAGNPLNFWNSPYRKERGLAPAWLREIGLDALEIQCTYGVRMPDQRASLFREQAELHDVALSVHAPYYITLGTADPKKRENSLRHLANSVELAKKLGSRRVIFHPGSAQDDRRAAMDRALKALQCLEERMDFGDVELFPEIGGKAGQLGSLDEILEICSVVGAAWPCLDLAHLHAREGGSLIDVPDFERIFDRVFDVLGDAAMHRLHVHLYPVRWGPKGETGHVPFDADHSEQSPDFRPFLAALVARSLAATVICEAKDSQDVGALAMQRTWISLRTV